jgi:DNA-binding CsgD family transcriptional regulator
LPTVYGERADSAHYVGREQELAYLRGVLHDAALGAGSVTILSGASGSGKSRLLLECARIDAPVEKIRACCDAAPLVGQDLRSQVAALPGFVKHKAVALLVDDVHLATADDLLALESLAKLAELRRLAVVATVSDERVGTRWSPRNARHRAIGDLDEQAIELLVRSLLKQRAPIGGSLLREIVGAAQGNPRFAIELAECAIRAGSADALLAPSAQTRVQEAQRILSATAYETLLLCSALGERVEARLVVEVSSRSKAAVVAALQEACDLRLLAEDPATPGAFFFRHAAVRKAAYLSMISPKRTLLHERIVSQLTAANDAADSALLGYQLDALQDHRRASAVLTEMASRLAERREFAAAADAYERAAGHLDAGSPEWFDVGHALVKCWERAGAYAPIVPLVEAMRSKDGFSAHPSAALTLEFLFFSYLNEWDWDAARSVAEQLATFDSSDAVELSTRALLVLAYAYARAGHRSEGLRLMRGIKVRGLASDGSRWRYQQAMLVLDAACKPLRVSLARADRAAKLGRKVGVAAVTYSFTEGIEIALEHGDLASAQKYAKYAVDSITGNSPNAEKLRKALVKTTARVCLYAGRLDEARALLITNLGWRDLGRYNEAFHAGIGVFVGMRTGDLPMVDAFFDPQLLSMAVSLGDAELCALLLPGFAEVMYARGMTGPLRDALRTCAERNLVDPYLSIQLCAARYAPIEELDVIERQVDAWRHDTVAPIAAAHASLVKAVLGRRRGKFAAAQGFARNAVAEYASRGWRLCEATALELAGDLRNAAHVYEACGAKTDAARVLSGQRRKLRRASFGARLTVRERDVARLVARRRSDREIAQALSISVRTVHHHVEAILSKLGVGRRMALTEHLLDGTS